MVHLVGVCTGHKWPALRQTGIATLDRYVTTHGPSREPRWAPGMPTQTRTPAENCTFFSKIFFTFTVFGPFSGKICTLPVKILTTFFSKPAPGAAYPLTFLSPGPSANIHL